MTKKERIADQINRLDRIIEWVKACDTKTSIVMTIAVLVPTFIVGTDWVMARLERILAPVSDAIKNQGAGCRFSCSNCIALCLLVLTLVLLGISLSRFIKVLIAKTSETAFGKDVKQDTLIHFHKISQYKDFESYKQMAECEKEEDYYEDLLSQTYINAKRCNEKFDNYNSGIEWLCRAVISLIIFIVSLFFVSI